MRCHHDHPCKNIKESQLFSLISWVSRVHVGGCKVGVFVSNVARDRYCFRSGISIWPLINRIGIQSLHAIGYWCDGVRFGSFPCCAAPLWAMVLPSQSKLGSGHASLDLLYLKTKTWALTMLDPRRSHCIHLQSDDKYKDKRLGQFYYLSVLPSFSSQNI